MPKNLLHTDFFTPYVCIDCVVAWVRVEKVCDFVNNVYFGKFGTHE